MASPRAREQLAKIWQLPLLVVSLGLFGYAAYLFIGPRVALTIPQLIHVAENNLKKGQFKPALKLCNQILDNEKTKPDEQARVHLMVARILADAQADRHISLSSNHQRIVEQTLLGLGQGGTPTADVYMRLAQSQESLDKIPDALAAYRQALVLDPARPLPLQRKIIEMELDQRDPTSAEADIDGFLKSGGISDADRAWGLGEKAQALARREKYAEAQPILVESIARNPREQVRALTFVPLYGDIRGAMTPESEHESEGVARYWLGYCIWKQGDPLEAERVLRVARDEMSVRNSWDADAAYALGKIRQGQHDYKEATSFFEAVMQSHPASHPAPLARLNRGLCRIALDNDPAGLSDLHAVVEELQVRKDRMSSLVEAAEGLKDASNALATKGNLEGAIESLEQEQALVPDPPPDFYSRLASVLDRRAEQVEQSIATTKTDAQREELDRKVRKLRSQAGDAYIALSRSLTLEDDRGQGEAMWKGIDLYDRAGQAQASIDAMERFVAERPDDGKTPDVLLRLGRAYQSTGQFDKAIKKYQQNQFRYPQSLAASRSGVPMAQAYVAKGSQSYPAAEAVLLGVLENNQILTPESEEFRQALFELAQLYYRTGRYEEAISRLEESTQRYPNDPRTSQLVFLMGDSYRKSAGLLAAVAQPPAPSNLPGDAVTASAAMATAAARTEAADARRKRLARAKILFDRVIELARTTAPSGDLERLYLKLSQFYRADCLYDLGQYQEAIKLYDSAALRYQDDPSAVAAYLQIVNAYCALGRFDDARTAKNRATWLLQKMPPGVFEDGRKSMPKQYWEDWLRWTSESGMYSRDLTPAAVSNAK